MCNKCIHVFICQMIIPYSGYYLGGKIFVNSEFLASSWKYFRGCGLLNHIPCRRGVEMACYFEVEAMV